MPAGEYMKEKNGLKELITIVTSHPDAEARRYAMYLLGMVGDSSVTGCLVSALRDTDKGVRARATIALASIGDVQPLCDLLKDADWKVRYRAAEALAHIRSPASQSALVEALSDEKDHVRYMAAKALGGIGGVSAVNALISLLKDQNEFVRRSVARSLGRIGDPVALPPLLHALDDEVCEAVRHELAGAITACRSSDK